MTTILVVDDEHSIAVLLSRWLKAAGYAVLTAESADAALEIASICPPAVLVSDIRMPGQSGIELLVHKQDMRATAFLTKRCPGEEG